MKPQKTPNRQRSLEKKEQSWRSHTPRFQTVPKIYSNLNSKVLA